MGEKRERARQSWEKFLEPQSLRTNLMSCSMFIVAWEMFRTSVIDNLRGFYTTGFELDEPILASEYRANVLDRHKSPLTASLLWFQEMGAIDQNDLDTVDRIRLHRNVIAHNLPKFIMKVDFDVDLELYSQLVYLTSKLDRWWILEIEVPSNSDHDRKEINESAVQSGNMLLLSLMSQIALGDESESGVAYEQFTEIWKSHSANL